MTTIEPTHKNRSGALIGGGILILFGLAGVASQLFPNLDFGLYVLPLVSTVFLLAGILGKRPGLLIPGCIIGGVGVGSILIDNQWFALTETAEGSLFFFALAAGFAMITVLTAIFAGRAQFWALIPAAGLALFGGTLLFGNAGLRILEIAGPVVLILIGAALILRRK